MFFVIFRHFEPINENQRESMKIYESMEIEENQRKFILLRRSRHFGNFFMQKSSFWWLFHAKVIVLMTFSCRSRYFGYFFMQKSSFRWLFHAKVVIWWFLYAKVVILMTFSCKSRHFGDFFMKKSSCKSRHFDDFFTQK